MRQSLPAAHSRSEGRPGTLAALGIAVALSLAASLNPWHAAPSRGSPVPAPPETLLREGDLLFRRGLSPLSRFVLDVDSSAKYSHVGILARVDGRLCVVHVSVGEDEPAPDRVRRDSLPAFLAGDRAAAWALYRLREGADRVGPLAAAAARRYLARRVAFDPAFDLRDETRLYCTELAWRAFREAGVDLARGPLDTFSLLGATRPMLSVSRLTSSPELQHVYSFPSSTRTAVHDQRGRP